MMECTLFALCLSVAERLEAHRDSGPPLIVEYYERPPYAWTGDDGAVRGLSVDTVRAALQKSGMSVRFVPVPPTRQLIDIAHAVTPLCAVARYKTPERETQARFSHTLVEERPYVAFSRRDTELGAETTIEEILQGAGRRVVVTRQKSYGAQLDAALASARSPLIPITGNAVNAVRMVEGQRADIAFLTLDEVEFVTKALDLPPSSYRISHITGLDRGEKNYLMCSRAAGDALLASIDAGLARLQ